MVRSSVSFRIFEVESVVASRRDFLCRRVEGDKQQSCRHPDIEKAGPPHAISSDALNSRSTNQHGPSHRM